eukprot:CAMPEP_0183342270 /NCGR_PEP_ID=MMETSP0164_2-20130417/8403_1 /TAXON_ID=221442 /ORGANISM="Coccolithus pelagicus ssp braarudi, Strain PLY182g" /LENGTH=187 /DNA_ID=CAMNT_0025512799 /DNA_START=14 /DNA_END=578 /DNA_ORIENTATION=-
MSTSFLSSQARASVGGRAHHRRARNLHPAERIAMAVSSLAFLFCAWAWAHSDHRRMSVLFCAVSALSICADAVAEPLIWDIPLLLVRIADRTCGSVALVLSVLLNSTSTTNFALSVLAASSALWWLQHARKAAKEQPHKRELWVARQKSGIAGVLLFCLPSLSMHMDTAVGDEIQLLRLAPLEKKHV